VVDAGRACTRRRESRGPALRAALPLDRMCAARAEPARLAPKPPNTRTPDPTRLQRLSMIPLASISRPCRAALAALVILTAAPAARAAEPWAALADPDSALALHFLHDGKPVFGVSLAGWGPKWAWVGMQSKPKTDGEKLSAGVPFVANKNAGEVINVRFEAARAGARQRLPRQRAGAGGRPAVRALRVDPRLTECLRGRGAGDRRGLRHGPPGLGRLL
jgi:hypothetical protein